MAIAYVQSDAGDFNTSPRSMSLGINPTAGSLIVCVAAWDNAAATVTITDNVGGVWAGLGSPQTGAGGLASYRIQFWYAANHPGGATNFTATLSGAGNVAQCYLEFSGVAPASPVDSGPLYSNFNGATPVTSTLTTVASDVVMVTVALISGGWTAGPDAPWTLDEFATFGANPIGHRIVSAQGNYTATFHNDPDQNILGIVGFKAPGQVVLPDADLATAGWTTTPLFSKLNDGSDATIITATAS